MKEKGKGLAILLEGASKGKGGEEEEQDDMMEEDDDSAKTDAASDVMSAIQNKDAAAFAEALETFVYLCKG